VVTVPFFLRHHLVEQVKATVRKGHTVHLVCGPGPELEEIRGWEGVTVKEIDIPREISPIRDIRALLKLFAYFLRERFDIVHSATPKAGLLAGLAGLLCRVPVRLHTFTGQPWVELSGALRFISRLADKMTSRFSTVVYADSPSQAEFLVAEKIVPRGRIRVIGKGSLSGVNISEFDRRRWTEKANAVRARLAIAEEQKVVVFVGRVTVDKGICELVDSAVRLRREGYSLALILVGPFEPHLDPLPPETLEAIQGADWIHSIGYTSEPQSYLGCADVMCLPSYREGFGMVVIEAAAMMLPAIGTHITGLRDAIVDGVTGILVPPKDVTGLSSAMARLLSDDALRMQMGSAAYQRVSNDFSADQINALLMKDYELLSRNIR
jgi:glycosyltransferase involved in cell wall biosynthesis